MIGVAVGMITSSVETGTGLTHDNIDTIDTVSLVGLRWRNSWQTALHCDFNGANTVQSKGCASCVVCGGKHTLISV